MRALQAWKIGKMSSIASRIAIIICDAPVPIDNRARPEGLARHLCHDRWFAEQMFRSRLVAPGGACTIEIESSTVMGCGPDACTSISVRPDQAR